MEARAGRRATVRYTDGTLASLARPGRPAGDLGRLAAGQALRDLTAQRSELASRGWRVTGRSRVVSQIVVERTRSPRSLVVSVCLDNSSVRVLDKKGHEIPSQSAARSRNLLTVVPRQGRWVVVAQAFPDDPTC